MLRAVIGVLVLADGIATFALGFRYLGVSAASIMLVTAALGAFAGFSFLKRLISRYTGALESVRGGSVPSGGLDSLLRGGADVHPSVALQDRMLGIAALLLGAPGFVGDTIGLLLLVPGVRAFIAERMLHRRAVAFVPKSKSPHSARPARRSTREAAQRVSQPRIIETTGVTVSTKETTS